MDGVTFHLEVFNGPLDLLLHLISKNKVDIWNIPIAKVLKQYLEYIDQARSLDMDVTSEFITMAAQLMYIKSKMLLPVYEDEQVEDPRASLVEALLEYQRFKDSATELKEMSELGRDLFVKSQEILEKDKSAVIYDYTAEVLIKAIENIFERSERKLPPPITAFQGIVGKEPVPVDDKISQLVHMLAKKERVGFSEFVLSAQSRSEIVAIFLAVLELSKAHKIMIEDCEDGYYLSIAKQQEQVISEDRYGV